MWSGGVFFFVFFFSTLLSFPYLTYNVAYYPLLVFRVLLECLPRMMNSSPFLVRLSLSQRAVSVVKHHPVWSFPFSERLRIRSVLYTNSSVSLLEVGQPPSTFIRSKRSPFPSFPCISTFSAFLLQGVNNGPSIKLSYPSSLIVRSRKHAFSVLFSPVLGPFDDAPMIYAFLFSSPYFRTPPLSFLSTSPLYPSSTRPPLLSVTTPFFVPYSQI